MKTTRAEEIGHAPLRDRWDQVQLATELIPSERVFSPSGYEHKVWAIANGRIFAANSTTVLTAVDGKLDNVEDFTDDLKPLSSNVKTCLRAYPSSDKCKNFITNMEVCPDGHTVVACGTNAYQPEIYYFNSSTPTRRSKSKFMCPKSTDVATVMKVSSCGDGAKDVDGVAVHADRAVKVAMSSHHLDVEKLASPTFLHISAALPDKYLYFFTENDGTNQFESFVGVTCRGSPSAFFKFQLKCSRQDFNFDKMLQVVEDGQDIVMILFSTPYDLYKKSTVCSYSISLDITPVLNNYVSCDSPESDFVEIKSEDISGTPVVPDATSEDETGSYSAIAMSSENVIILGTENGHILTASKFEDEFHLISRRKMSPSCGESVIDIKTDMVEDRPTVFVAYQSCIASTAVSDCSSLETSCCDRTPYCRSVDGSCLPSVDDFPLELPIPCTEATVDDPTTQTTVVSTPNQTVQTTVPTTIKLLEPSPAGISVVPVAVVGLIAVCVMSVVCFLLGRRHERQHNELPQSDPDWVDFTPPTSSTSTAKTRPRIKTSPAKKSPTMRSNRSDDGDVGAERTIPSMGVSSISSKHNSSLNTRRSMETS